MILLQDTMVTVLASSFSLDQPFGASVYLLIERLQPRLGDGVILRFATVSVVPQEPRSIALLNLTRRDRWCPG